MSDALTVYLVLAALSLVLWTSAWLELRGGDASGGDLRGLAYMLVLASLWPVFLAVVTWRTLAQTRDRARRAWRAR